MELGGLKKDDFQVSVPYGEDAEVVIRHMSREEILELNRRATRKTFVRHQPAEEVDSIQADILLGRAAVRGWKGLTMDGVEFPYSPENCDFLMKKSVDFALFVNRTCTDLQELQLAAQEEERKQQAKNSLNTSGAE